jgi:hypothetical protein
MLGAIEFNFPIRGPNNRLIDDYICLAAVRALVTAYRTRLVGASVDVNHVGHWPDYTADSANRV